MSHTVVLSPRGSGTRSLELEYTWICPEKAGKSTPVLIFLHEGLGCLDLWRKFPTALCERLQWRALVYSRFAYGASTPRPHDEPFPHDYLEREALDVLPALLDVFAIKKPWLLGHSDGGSNALIAAAREAARYSGIVTIAPHYCVEDICLKGIQRAKDNYEGEGDLRARLAKYHKDVDSAFYGWCDAWLNPARRGWSIEGLLKNIASPSLAIQGVQDEYATLDQIRTIKRHAPQTALLEIDGCGHFPFLTRADEVIDAIATFASGH